MGNRAFDGAERKGRTARDEGKPITANPYPDWRTHRGSVTFARGFWRAWRKGWEDRNKEIADAECDTDGS